ncbi:MAG: diguanylate cyclase [Treponema sp.]|nr:diguanylate cyclase [Treponema sp.]
MKSSVDNFILIIDSIRTKIITDYEKNGIKYTEEDVKNETLSFIRNIVHESTFANGAYIWINEVTDFNGGENYGIRQVHGNLPETEGIALSTLTKDAGGNTPYLTELEGIKKDGEITYKYYFKEYKSENISEKVTYARLYRPYNWIVCTGTYLNSMYEPAGGVSHKKKLIFYSSCFLSFITSLILFFYIMISNCRNSRKLMTETENLKLKVSKDSLTGAGSRAFGDSLLHEYYSTYQTCGKNYAIAILDIDNFKPINDKYGHNSGDAVIKKIVSTVEKSLNMDDHIIRWGGDEFILTFNTIPESLEKKLGQINKNIKEESVRSSNGEIINFSVSIGASYFIERDNCIEDTIKRIDDALYLAKRRKNSFYII